MTMIVFLCQKQQKASEVPTYCDSMRPIMTALSYYKGEKDSIFGGIVDEKTYNAKLEKLNALLVEGKGIEKLDLMIPVWVEEMIADSELDDYNGYQLTVTLSMWNPLLRNTPLRPIQGRERRRIAGKRIHGGGQLPAGLEEGNRRSPPTTTHESADGEEEDEYDEGDRPVIRPSRQMTKQGAWKPQKRGIDQYSLDARDVADDKWEDGYTYAENDSSCVVDEESLQYESDRSLQDASRQSNRDRNNNGSMNDEARPAKRRRDMQQIQKMIDLDHASQNREKARHYQRKIVALQNSVVALQEEAERLQRKWD